jgi:hypothetical protein
LLADRSQFATSGAGASTMATQAAAGSRLGEAQQQGQMSDVNQSAMERAYYNQVQGELSGLANQLTIQNQGQNFLNQLISGSNQSGTDLSGFAGLAGFGQGTGGFGQSGIDALEGGTGGFTGTGTANLAVG